MTDIRQIVKAFDIGYFNSEYETTIKVVKDINFERLAALI
jgi:hypothetical protein